MLPVVVPTLYAGLSRDCALAESLLHDIPTAGPGRRLSWARLQANYLSPLVTIRDLHLVALHGAGIRRLGLRAVQLTDTTPLHYPRTVSWAQAAHRWDGRADGMVWMSRQLNSEHAVLLFGDRVGSGDLTAAEPPMTLDDQAIDAVTDLLVRVQVILGLD